LNLKDRKFMANHNNIGAIGEEIAEKFLLDANYKILAKNWRWQNLELDLIAKKNGVLVFVEVKCRENRTFGFPEDAVGRKKEERIYQAAAEYMYRINYEEEIRFDIIAITLEPILKIEHFEDAFFPIW
jgi:putative endonuclease